MKLPAILQIVGLVYIPIGVFLLFGAGWCILISGAAVTVLGTALELERR